MGAFFGPIDLLQGEINEEESGLKEVVSIERFYWKLYNEAF